MLSVFFLSVEIYLLLCWMSLCWVLLCCHYAESHYAESHYAEWRYAECRGAHKTIRSIQFRNKLRVYCTKFTALLDTFFRFVKKPLETRVFIKKCEIFFTVYQEIQKKCFSKFLLLSMTKTTKDQSYKTVLFVSRVYIGGVKHDVAISRFIFLPWPIESILSVLHRPRWPRQVLLRTVACRSCRRFRLQMLPM